MKVCNLKRRQNKQNTSNGCLIIFKVSSCIDLLDELSLPPPLPETLIQFFGTCKISLSKKIESYPNI